MALTKKQKRLLADYAEGEGEDYCFMQYSDFSSEIKDEKFHELLTKWREARAEFFEYIELEKYLDGEEE